MSRKTWQSPFINRLPNANFPQTMPQLCWSFMWDLRSMERHSCALASRVSLWMPMFQLCLLWGSSNTGTERSWSLHLWRYWKPNWACITKCMFNISRFLFGLYLPYVETVFQIELLFSISNLSLFGLKFSLKYDHDNDKKLLSFDLNWL